jgi:hypothetical protein
MAVQTGRVYVPWPNALVPRPGLFQVATGPLDLPVHGRIGGVQFETGTCAFPNCYTINCIDSHGSKTLTNQKSVITGDPFIVYSSVTCAPVGLDDPRLKNFLYEQLAGAEQGVVENVLSQGLCGAAPSLANNTPLATDLTPTPGTAVDPVKAVSLLEDWLYARYGLMGVLHVPAALASYFDFLWLGDMNNRGVWTTHMGTQIVFGNYSGKKPDGTGPAAGEKFIYITGQVAVWRTSDADLFVTTIDETLNRTTNQVTAVMEREYIVTYDCFAAAVETKITGVVA